MSDKNSTLDISIDISNSTFNELTSSLDSTVQNFLIYIMSSGRIVFNNNKVNAVGYGVIVLNETSAITLNKNKFSPRNMGVSIGDQKSSIEILDNVFDDEAMLRIDGLRSQDQIDWSQFKDKLVSTAAKSNLRTSLREKGVGRSYLYSKKFNALYKDSIRFHNKTVYGNEIGLIGTFYKYYKSKYNTEVANEVYLELKDFETKRFEVLHQQNPSFKTYFTWKVNQFLKIFSAYGTEPARAIIFSLYVILLFAFIYLFFPNSWDSHGKNRIMDRFRFFTKYMNKDAGMHDVYLEGQQDELLASEDFKNYMQQSEKHIPKFFMTTAMPLYKWSVSGTKLSASFLRRIDIMKGTWSELPKSKTYLEICFAHWYLLQLLILYDILIKISKRLNALHQYVYYFRFWGNPHQRIAALLSHYTRFYWVVYVDYI